MPGDFFIQRAIIGDDAAQVSKRLDVLQLCVVDSDRRLLRRACRRRLKENLGLTETDCQAEQLCSFRELVSDSLQMVFLMGHQGTIISEQRLN